MPLPGSGNISLLDIRNEIGGAGSISLLDANSGAEGGALSWTGCGSWNVDGSTPVALTDWYGYDDSYSGCTSNGTLVISNDCSAFTNYGCGVDGDTYNVYHNGCCGYSCTFVQSGCI